MNVLDQAKKLLYASYNSKEARGVFLSLIDKTGKLLVSNGVLLSDKALDLTIDTLYYGTIDKVWQEGMAFLVDVVTELRQETDMNTLLQTSLNQYGLFVHTLDTSKSGVLLPHTAGVEEMKQALTTLQKKYKMDGNVQIYLFQTERFVIQ